MHRRPLVLMTVLFLSGCGDRVGPLAPDAAGEAPLAAAVPDVAARPGGSAPTPAAATGEALDDAVDRVLPALGPAGGRLQAALLELRAAALAANAELVDHARSSVLSALDRLAATAPTGHAADLDAIRLALASSGIEPWK